MAKVNITDAAKLAGIGRQHMYRKYINPRDKDGKILTPLITVEIDNLGNKVIDTSEILRVFKVLHTVEGDIGELDASDSRIRKETEKSYTTTSVLAKEVELLREQLSVAKLKAADAQRQADVALGTIQELKQDKAWLKEKVDSLTDALKQIEHKTAVEPDPGKRPWWKKLW